MSDKQLEYLVYNSLINPSFWHKLTQLKLDVDKLSESERTIWASQAICINTTLQKQFVEVDSTSFNESYDAQHLYLPFKGKILNKNTIEQFKECDKNELMQAEAEKLLQLIKGDAILNEPSSLNTFFILSFADLKKYHYYYWFAFPAPYGLHLSVIDCFGIDKTFSDDQLEALFKAFLELPQEHKPYFILNATGIVSTLDSVNLDAKIEGDNETYFAFLDVSNSKVTYSWSLKNYVALLIHNSKFKSLLGKAVNFLAFRLTKCDKELSIGSSQIIKVQLPEDISDSGWVGWERNERGNMGPRMANMKSSMDPKNLSETSVDLNLKLMKWRLLPDIDLERIKSLKCLLLGSGTLGCSVARVLLGWGVRHIDFVDNATVSYSNPVRQSLFTFDDCIASKAKAIAAAENLQKVFPGVKSKGYTLSIPMPGHPVGESLLAQTKENFTQLDQLISESDIVFLLMDSRESRWLPTLLAQCHGKIVLNAALGFDSYLVMRHGLRSTGEASSNGKEIEGYEMIKGEELGCYFCNDVTAPGNSLKDRTLDQQCTVTRPGVSQIAGALAVELAISLTQHSLGARAPAYYRKHQKSPAENMFSDLEVDDCLLGLLPHSIRGFLSNYNQVLPATQRYTQCIACSDVVLKTFKSDGFEWLLTVFESSKVLEDLTGLTAIHDVDPNLGEWDLSDEDESY